MPISLALNMNASAFLLILLSLYVPMAGAATTELAGLPMLQVLAMLDDSGWSAVIAGVMLMFGLLFGRALIEVGGRLPPFDRLLWLLLLLVGVGAGGVVLATGHEQAAMMLWCALALALLMAIIAWRCQVLGESGGPVFAIAALSAVAGPVWVAWLGAEAGADLGWLVGAVGVVLGLSLLGAPLLWAISFRSDAGIEAQPAMTRVETPAVGPARDQLPEQAPPESAAATTGGARPATGLATPAMLLERLGHGMRRSERANLPLALLWVDVRGTPEVVRLFGDEAGEQLLAEVSRRLDEALRLESSLSRTGEHCFAAVCEAVTDLEEVLTIMNRLREKLAPPCELSDGAIRIDASFGHALFPHDGTDVKTLCRIAARRARGALRRESRTIPMRLLEGHGLSS